MHLISNVILLQLVTRFSKKNYTAMITAKNSMILKKKIVSKIFLVLGFPTEK